jgi:hypothetical protein
LPTSSGPEKVCHGGLRLSFGYAGLHFRRLVTGRVNGSS